MDLKKHVDLYFNKSGGFVFSALLCVSLLPWLMNALLVMWNKNVLPAAAPVLTAGFGAAAAWVFISCSVLRLRGTRFSPQAFLSAAAELFLKGGAGALAVMLLFQAAKLLFVSQFEMLRAGNPILA